MDNIDVDSFLELSNDGVVIDVRTPAEFEMGHIPGAINLPIFSNEERAVVGTIYKKISKEKAVEKGLDFVGVKLGNFVRFIKKYLRANNFSQNTPINIYCWRGGMRSNSMAWLFATAGFKTNVLKGGYKAYRASFIAKLNNNYWKYIVIGGPTGCGKTYVLEELKRKGEQVVDLEFLAKHRGSAFGYFGHLEPQPSCEHFANLLYDELLKKDNNRVIWCEGESISIGRVFMPQEFYAALQNSEMIHFDMERELRLTHIMKDYGDCPTDTLQDCFKHITKRLGYDRTKLALELIERGAIREAAEIALDYYDRGYAHSLDSRTNKIKHRVFMNEDDCEKAAQILIEKLRDI